VENPNRLQLALMLNRRFIIVVENVQVMDDARSNSSIPVISGIVST
jgi:hypothetical protein